MPGVTKPPVIRDPSYWERLEARYLSFVERVQRHAAARQQAKVGSTIAALFPTLQLRPKGIRLDVTEGRGRRWHPTKRGPGRSPKDRARSRAHRKARR